MKKSNSSILLTLASAFLVWANGSPSRAGESPAIVKDINNGGGSAPTELVTMGGLTFFAADDGPDGVELWKSDGTAAGTMLVKDICPGACSSAPFQLTVATLPAGERLLFSAYTPSQGYELWKSDGTAGGTVLVKEINSGTTSGGIGEITAVGSGVFFKAAEVSTGYELWKSDGTEAGTTLVKDIAAGWPNSTPTFLTDVGGTLFFSALGPEGRELRKSDGTEAGTVVVKDISPGSGSSNASRLTAVGNTLFFMAISGTGYELWKSNGTAAGTTQVRNINPGFESSYPDHLTAHGNLLYFAADDGVDGVELWKSDGTYAGTVQVKDINANGPSSSPSQLTVMGGTLYFTADDGSTGAELWKSDGTYAGTVRVKDIFPGAQSSGISELTAAGDFLYLSADDGSIGRELWRSDGTGAGTEFWNINAAEAPSTPTQPTESSNLVFFAADDGVAGRELWALQIGGPVLGLSKVFSDDTVEVATSNHTFALTVSNTGTGPATSVRITDPVDSRLTVVSVSPPAECDGSFGQFVDCTFPILDPAALETVTGTYSVASGAALGQVVNVAEAGEFGGPLVEASDTVEIVEPCFGEDYVEIFEEIIDYPDVREACIAISAGPTVNLMLGADVTLSSGGIVILNDGFVVESGALLTIGN